MRYLSLILLILTFTGTINGDRITAQAKGKISRIGISNNSIFLFDSGNSSVWKLNKQGQVTAIYNNKGEGPGELKSIVDFQFLPDGLHLFSSNKCLKTDYNLQYQTEFKITYPFVKLNRTNKIVCKMENDIQCMKHNVYMVINNKVIQNITEVLHKKKQGKFTAFTPIVRVKIFNNTQNFAVSKSYYMGIKIFSLDGKLVKDITLQTKLIPVTKEFKELFFESIFRDPRFQGQTEIQKMVRKKVYFSDNLPNMQDFYIDSVKGDIYIKTYERKGGKSAFLKYCKTGKFIKKYFLIDEGIDLSNQSNYTVFNNKTYYYLYENEEGDYVIYYQDL